MEGAVTGELTSVINLISHDVWARSWAMMGFIVDTEFGNLVSEKMELKHSATTRANALGSIGFNVGWKGMQFGWTQSFWIAKPTGTYQALPQLVNNPGWQITCEHYLVHTNNQVHSELGGDRGGPGNTAKGDFLTFGQWGSEHWFLHEQDGGGEQ